MPSWAGWDESTVRQVSSHRGWMPVNASRSSNISNSPIGFGFTAINGLSAPAIKPDNVVSTTDNFTGQDVAKTGGSRRSQRRPTVASGYLGRVADPEALHGVDAETTAKTRGKKRSRQPRSQSTAGSKRQKSGNVSSTMSVSKASVSATMMQDDDSVFDVDSDVLSSTDMDAFLAPPYSKANSQQHDHTTSLGGVQTVNNDSRTRPISVFSQSTSMEMFLNHQTQTTMGSLRKKTHDDSVSREQWQANALSSANEQQRLLESEINATATPAANARVLRPWIAKASTPGSTTHNVPPQTKQRLTPMNSDPVTQTFPRTRSLKEQTEAMHITRSKSDKVFAILGDEDEADLIDLTEYMEAFVRSKVPPRSSQARDWKQNMRDVDEHEDYGGALFSQAEKRLLMSLKKNEGSRKPIARTTFPPAVLDRSSLCGASNAVVLRTCFRVGEALNTGCQAVRKNKHVVLELYARVTASWRDARPSRKQHFVIKDLYHDNSPHLNGTFELWDQSALWELDSKPFLTAGPAGVMCRMISRMKRDGTKWRLEILSIWQADWEGIEQVAGIYAGPGDNA